jgi:hypothetical protein
MNDCPWCHGTDTQFCENPECRPQQPQPAQYRGEDDGACLGVFVSLSIWVMGGILTVIIISIVRLIQHLT